MTRLIALLLLALLPSVLSLVFLSPDISDSELHNALHTYKKYQHGVFSSDKAAIAKVKAEAPKWIAKRQLNNTNSTITTSSTEIPVSTSTSTIVITSTPTTSSFSNSTMTSSSVKITTSAVVSTITGPAGERSTVTRYTIIGGSDGPTPTATQSTSSTKTGNAGLQTNAAAAPLAQDWLRIGIAGAVIAGIVG